MSDESERGWVVEGIDGERRRFRPGDWVERLVNGLASFAHEQRIHFESEVHPCTIRGERYLVVGKALSQRRPELYAYVLEFAQENELRIQEERRIWALPVGVERREQTGR